MISKPFSIVFLFFSFCLLSSLKEIVEHHPNGAPKVVRIYSDYNELKLTKEIGYYSDGVKEYQITYNKDNIKKTQMWDRSGKKIKIEDGYSFQVKFDDILSLTKGNDVIYSGLTIGEVREVGKIGGANSAEITPIVTLSIKEEYEDILYKDAIFTIKSPLFVGDYWVEVTRGIPRSQDKIAKGEVLEGVAELNPSKLPAEIQKGLKPILINFDAFSESLVSLFNPSNVENLKESVENIKKVTKKAKMLVDKIDIEGESVKLDMAVFNETMENLSAVSKELKTSLSNFESGSEDFKIAMKSLKELLDEIKNGDGTASKIINDDKLYDNANKLLEKGNTLLDTLINNPSALQPRVSIWK